MKKKAISFLTAFLTAISCTATMLPTITGTAIAASTSNVKFDEDEFYVAVGTCKGATQLRYFAQKSDGSYTVEKVVWEDAPADISYGDVFIGDGNIEMTKVMAAPDNPVYAMAYYYQLDDGEKLNKVGKCDDLMEKKVLTVSSKTYDGSAHWSIRYKDSDGKEYYYGLSNFASTLTVDPLDCEVGDVYTYALCNDYMVIPLAKENDISDVYAEPEYKIVKLPDKVEYKLGEQIDLKGIEIEVTKDKKEPVVYTYPDVAFDYQSNIPKSPSVVLSTDFRNDKAGTYKIEVVGADNVCFDVKVVDDSTIKDLGVFEEGEKMTLDDVIALSKKGNALTLNDFVKFKGVIAGSGIFILEYDLGKGYTLMVGSAALDKKIVYARLRYSGSENYIDIRTDDVEAFIAEMNGKSDSTALKGTETLTIDIVKELSKKGSALDWKDFEEYKGRDVGSGLYIWEFTLEDGYVLDVGGTIDKKPLYILLSHDDDKGIDIRTDDVEKYLSTSAEVSNIKGDANCDGQVDLSDAVMIMQALANPNKYGLDGTAEHHLTEQGKLNGDMNGDGLTSGDALAIQRKLLGLDNDENTDNDVTPSEPTTIGFSNYEEYKKYIEENNLADKIVTYDKLSQYGEFVQFTINSHWMYDNTFSLFYIFNDGSGKNYDLIINDRPQQLEDLVAYPKLTDDLINKSDMRTANTDADAYYEFDNKYYIYTNGKLSQIKWFDDKHIYILIGNPMLYDYPKVDNTYMSKLLDISSTTSTDNSVIAGKIFAYEKSADPGIYDDLCDLSFGSNGTYVYHIGYYTSSNQDQGTWEISGDTLVLTGQYGTNKFRYEDKALIYIAEESDGFSEFNDKSTPKDGEKFILAPERTYDVQTKSMNDVTVSIKSDLRPHMSDLSGIGILLDVKSNDYPVTLKATDGNFVEWDIEKGSGPVKTVGKEYDIGKNGYIFWNPDKLYYQDGFESEIQVIGVSGDVFIDVGKIYVSQVKGGIFEASFEKPSPSASTDNSVIAGKIFAYEKEGAGGYCTLSFNENGRFLYSPGKLSSYMGGGDWKIDGDTVSLIGMVDKTIYLKINDDTLVYIAESSDEFPYMDIKDGEKFGIYRPEISADKFQLNSRYSEYGLSDPKVELDLIVSELPELCYVEDVRLYDEDDNFIGMMSPAMDADIWNYLVDCHVTEECSKTYYTLTKIRCGQKTYLDDVRSEITVNFKVTPAP